MGKQTFGKIETTGGYTLVSVWVEVETHPDPLSEGGRQMTKEKKGLRVVPPTPHITGTEQESPFTTGPLYTSQSMVDGSCLTLLITTGQNPPIPLPILGLRKVPLPSLSFPILFLFSGCITPERIRYGRAMILEIQYTVE